MSDERWDKLDTEGRRQLSARSAAQECADQGIDLIGTEEQHRGVAAILRQLERTQWLTNH